MFQLIAEVYLAVFFLELDGEVNHRDISGRSLQGGILGILIGHVLEQAHDVAE